MRAWGLFALAGLWAPAGAVAQAIVAPGVEGFWGVWYIGGDATHTQKEYGFLILTDSTLEMHDCAVADCRSKDKGFYWKPAVTYSIDLRHVTSVESSHDIRGPSTGSKLLLGGLATDRKQEFVLVDYESGSSAEAPVFKTPKNQAAAVEAKVRYRLKHLGITPPDSGSSAH